mmetsp:Transcript_63729/g.170761  ORF Transcript_63729/g.170761 Transcript_63729/m.170761 type:complete len:448 (-) Transcript_63729:70-1413(-)
MGVCVTKSGSDPKSAVNDIVFAGHCASYRLTEQIGRGTYSFVRVASVLPNSWRKKKADDEVPDEIVAKVVVKHLPGTPDTYREVRAKHQSLVGELKKAHEARKKEPGPDADKKVANLQVSIKECQAILRVNIKSTPMDRITVELNNLELAQDSSLTRLFDWGEDEFQFYFIFPRYGLDLAVWPGDHNCTEPDLAEMCTGVLRGLKFLHSKRMCHRDVKPANILLTADAPREGVVLGDLGLACVLEPGIDQYSDQVGSEAFMAPEVFDGHGTFASDVWALGIAVVKVWIGRFPPRTTREMSKSASGLRLDMNQMRSSISKQYSGLSHDMDHSLTMHSPLVRSPIDIGGDARGDPSRPLDCKVVPSKKSSGNLSRSPSPVPTNRKTQVDFADPMFEQFTSSWRQYLETILCPLVERPNASGALEMTVNWRSELEAPADVLLSTGAAPVV